ncbi:MAG: inorganic phosphate transporter [Solirubrobacteraceae bacterium]
MFAALIGAIIWNLITWYVTLPSSSSHALIGGVIGATLVAGGAHAVKFHGIAQSVIAPAILSPIICFLVAGLGTLGVITLALIAHGSISSSHFYVPLWVKLACAIGIASDTAIGGWRIINTMGNRITNVESPRGFAAEAASAAVILSSSFYGYPLSTTHVVSGGVMGAGAGRKLESVHWGVAGQMATAWLFTIPAAGILGAATWEVARLFGANSSGGTIVMAILAAGAAAVLFQLAQRNKVGANGLDRTHVPPEREAQAFHKPSPAPV